MTIMIRLMFIVALVNMQQLTGNALAQDYPTKPIHIITAGGPDIVARIFGKKITEALGQPTVAENVPGAGGKIAAERVARSRPDGYTILNAVASLMIVTAMQKDVPDQSKDFAPIASANSLPYVLTVTAGLPVTSVKEFIALAKSRPGKLNYTGANGTFAHLSFELFKSMAQIDVFHIPMGVPQATAAMISGQIDAVIATPAQIAGARQGGKVRLLAVTTAQRSRLLPDTPTLAESGLSGYNLVGWNGFIAPLGTPPTVMARLNGVVRQALKQPDVLKQLADIAYEPGWDYSPEQFGEFLKVEAQKWKVLAEKVGVKSD